MVILEESEFGQQGYQLWFEMFVFIDMICCFLIIFPIVWWVFWNSSHRPQRFHDVQGGQFRSMHHLSEGATSDGKAAFNLEKLRLFRHFYMIVISYVYLTRVLKLLLQVRFCYLSDLITTVNIMLVSVCTSVWPRMGYGRCRRMLHSGLLHSRGHTIPTSASQSVSKAEPGHRRGGGYIVIFIPNLFFIFYQLEVFERVSY